jgi:hypothetical protein
LKAGLFWLRALAKRKEAISYKLIGADMGTI